MVFGSDLNVTKYVDGVRKNFSEGEQATSDEVYFILLFLFFLGRGEDQGSNLKKRNFGFFFFWSIIAHRQHG